MGNESLGTWKNHTQSAYIVYIDSFIACCVRFACSQAARFGQISDITRFIEIGSIPCNPKPIFGGFSQLLTQGYQQNNAYWWWGYNWGLGEFFHERWTIPRVSSWPCNEDSSSMGRKVMVPLSRRHREKKPGRWFCVVFVCLSYCIWTCRCVYTWSPNDLYFGGQPPKTRPFPTKTRVVWVRGILCRLICIYINVSEPVNFWETTIAQWLSKGTLRHTWHCVPNETGLFRQGLFKCTSNGSPLNLLGLHNICRFKSLVWGRFLILYVFNVSRRIGWTFRPWESPISAGGRYFIGIYEVGPLL